MPKINQEELNRQKTMRTENEQRFVSFLTNMDADNFTDEDLAKIKRFLCTLHQNLWVYRTCHLLFSIIKENIALRLKISYLEELVPELQRCIENKEEINLSYRKDRRSLDEIIKLKNNLLNPKKVVRKRTPKETQQEIDERKKQYGSNP